MLRDGLEPLEAIEGDGFETGLGAGRGAATDPREEPDEPDERGGETRLIDGGLERGATRFTVGGLGA